MKTTPVSLNATQILFAKRITSSKKRQNSKIEQEKTLRRNAFPYEEINGPSVSNVYFEPECNKIRLCSAIIYDAQKMSSAPIEDRGNGIEKIVITEPNGTKNIFSYKDGEIKCVARNWKEKNDGQTCEEFYVFDRYSKPSNSLYRNLRTFEFDGTRYVNSTYFLVSKQSGNVFEGILPQRSPRNRNNLTNILNEYII